MKLRETIAPLLAAGALAGGIGAQESAATAELSPIQRSLNTFRNGVILKHQAKILMETCVAWPNATGLTITWNPGVGGGKVDYQGASHEYRYYVFSTHDSQYTPSWGPLNGPFIEPLGMNQVDPLTLAFKPEHPVKSGLVRKISSKEVKGANGETHYNDLQTGEPVMDTVLTTGSFTQDHVAVLCEALRDGKPMSGTA